MTKILIWGVGGKMGQTLVRLIKNRNDCEFFVGVDKFATPDDFRFPVVNDFRNIEGLPDVIVDFSRPEALDDILEYASAHRLPVVLCTTGYSEDDLKKIKEYSLTAPVFMSANMSLGINLLAELIEKTVKFLGDGFDVEIIEKHHNQKVDAPSGTALLLANAVKDAAGEGDFVFGRHGKNELRKKKDVGIHAVRGGTIVGEHDVIFAGNNEVITISHSAQSKEIFANGAISAAKFVDGKPAGMYSMRDMLHSAQ